MLNLLKIEDLGVIAEAELPLTPGFTAITGETGAGKTMVITALGLLMGERSAAQAVRTGADRARVSGFLTTTDARVLEAVEDAGGDTDGDELTLVRSVTAEGRSRASVGGASAPAQVLQRLAPNLFAVHGQSEQLRLKTSAAQREALDRFAGVELDGVLKRYTQVFEQAKKTQSELEMLQTRRLERVREAERLQAELNEIDEVDPQPGELEAVQEAVSRLGNIEELRYAAQTAQGLLAGSDFDDAGGASHLLAQSERELERAATSDAQLQNIFEQLRSLTVQLDEVVRELGAYSNSLDFDGPAELAKASARLEQLTKLTRKYGDTVEEVLEFRAEAAERLQTLSGDDLRIEELEKEATELEEVRGKLQQELTRMRKEAAQSLSNKVTEELKHLALPDAVFGVTVAQATPGRYGADSVELLLQPHPGATLRPVAKGASGGELSRVMLALEVVLAGKDPVPTFVFDEIDAGIGGSAAIEVGRRLARLAQSSQVIVVTHLAQVAAFADNHLAVQKDSAGGFTKSSCRQLQGSERLSEMARLLSGMSDSASALQHAAELLELAR